MNEYECRGDGIYYSHSHWGPSRSSDDVGEGVGEGDAGPGRELAVTDVPELDDCDFWPGDIVAVKGAGSEMRYRVDLVRKDEVRATRVSGDRACGAPVVLASVNLTLAGRPRGSRYVKTEIGWSLLSGRSA